jgi:hypothetical protein
MVLALALALVAGNCAVATPVSPQIRTADCATANLLRDGRERSATFRRLVDRIGALNGIVYVTSGYVFRPGTRRLLPAALQHRIVLAGSYRLLYITLSPASGDRAIETLGHELQHVVEVLESGATSDAAVTAFFERTGIHAGSHVTETEAALTAGRAVAKELIRSRE